MRILKYTIKNILRNKFLSFSSILVLTLIIFFINILLLLNYTTKYIINNVNSRLTISLNLKSWYTNENSEIIDLISNIKAFNKNLSVSYISAEEAFKVLSSRDPELAKIVESEKNNPLPSSILVKNIWLTEYENIDKIIIKYKNIIVYDEEKSKKNITDYKAQYQKINDVIKIFTSIQYWIYSIIWFFIFSVFIIIYNIVWNFVFFYREEIKITKLVWWDNVFVYWPFSLQWVIYTLIASFLSIVIFIYLIKTINIYLIDDFPKFINNFLFLNYRYFLIEIWVISIVWAISWFLSSVRFINAKV